MSKKGIDLEQLELENLIFDTCAIMFALGQKNPSADFLGAYNYDIPEVKQNVTFLQDNIIGRLEAK